MSAAVTERDSLALSKEQFQRLAGFISGHLGIKMNEVKLPMLQSRLMRRMRALSLPTLEAYEAFLFSPNGQAEVEAFVNAVTTNKTDFFREPKHFEILTNRVVPEWVASRPVRPRFQLWCAGCSSGEEAYTQAMVLSEWRRQQPSFDYVILATDISTRVLGLAERAIYDEERIAPIPEPLRRAHLLRSRSQEGRYRMSAELRSKIHFHQLNFMDEHYRVGDQFDAIFIRNVMIYFDRPTQEKVVRRLCQHLAPGGYLFIGHSESLNGLQVPVRLAGPALYRKVG